MDAFGTPSRAAEAKTDTGALLADSSERAFGAIPRRETLHRSALATVEDTYIAPDGPYPAGFETRFQLALTYYGAFSYKVGRRDWIIDANSSLFISPGWTAHEEHLLPETGHAAIIITPSSELLDEICAGAPPGRTAAFLAGSVPASMHLRFLAHSMLRTSATDFDRLRKDEWTVRAIAEAAVSARTNRIGRSSKVVDRAKAFLHANLGERLSLQQVADAVGVTPVYLTTEFSRYEGTPLYRYQRRLRLSQALLNLPCESDITGLALDLGFCSHSHFSASFLDAFGITPSEYRQASRRRQLAFSRRRLGHAPQREN